MEEISIQQYFRQLLRGWKTILAATTLFTFAAVLYCVFFFQPSYKAQAKLLIQEIEPTVFVADIGKKQALQTGGTEKNPVLTQMQIIASYDLAARVYDGLVSEKWLPAATTPADRSDAISQLQDAVKLKNPPSTDIIELGTNSKSPLLSYRIAKSYVDQYRQYDMEINNQTLLATKKFIVIQLKKSEEELKDTREAIKNFRLRNQTIDLPTEISSIVEQGALVQKEILDLDGKAHYHRKKVSELSTKLNITPREASKVVDAVAIGQNDSINVLRQSLHSAEQEYAALSVRYPETTKRMAALKESINQTKKQINSQVAQTVGKSLAVNSPIIKDTVRTDLVKSLIDNQTELSSIEAQKTVLIQALNDLHTQQDAKPKQQIALAELLEREANLENIVNTLNSKLVETTVREAEKKSIIRVVDSPVIPDEPMFPSAKHIILIMAFSGMLLGGLIVLAQYYLRDLADTSEEYEARLGIPVISELPWLPRGIYKNHLLSSALNDLGYQHIVASLILAGDRNKRVIGFTCLSSTKNRCSIVPNIGRLLSDCGYRVLIIDADLHFGDIANELGLPSQQTNGLDNLLKRLSAGKSIATPYKDIEQNAMIINVEPEQHIFPAENLDNALLKEYILKVPDEKSLYLLTNSEHQAGGFKLVSKNLSMLIKEVRSKFDIVLIDTPPILSMSDALVISRNLDGLISLCGLDTSRATLKRLRKICDDNDVPLMGAITRKYNMMMPGKKYAKA